MNYFEERRKKYFTKLENNSISLFYSDRLQEEAINNDKYDVNRDTYYLSGLFNYGHILLISRINNEYNEVLFIAPFDEHKALWETVMTANEAKEISGITCVKYLNEFDSYLDSIVERAELIYLDMTKEEIKSKKGENNSRAIKLKNKYQKRIKTSHPLLQDLRFVKDEYEIACLKKAINATRCGIMNVLDALGEMKEYQLESYFDQGIKYNGANGFSFPSIFASGVNSCCLHYSDNNSDTKNGDLLLIDVGGSYNMYCGDISRTFPVSGVYSKRQKEIYNIVLGAQEKVMSLAKPGVTRAELQDAVKAHYAVELKKIGLIDKDEDVIKYYYHHVTHHIGILCHDDVDYDRPLEAGCVISNEPGLYIKEEAIGVRIEDDILITENGAINLSEDIIKSPDEIEKYLKERNV